MTEQPQGWRRRRLALTERAPERPRGPQLPPRRPPPAHIGPPPPAILPTRYFIMRVRRDGPLVPARLRWLDHAPLDPADNKLDRGRVSVFPVVDIAGVDVEPEQLFDRLMSSTDSRPAHAQSHWKYALPVSEAEYRHQFDRMRWAEQASRDDPVLKPRKRVELSQLELPNFDRENAL